MTASIDSNAGRAGQETAATPRFLRWTRSSALVPSLALGALLLALQPVSAAVPEFASSPSAAARIHLPAGLTTGDHAGQPSDRIVVAARVGRLLKNGTRVRSRGQDDESAKSKSNAGAEDNAVGQHDDAGSIPAAASAAPPAPAPSSAGQVAQPAPAQAPATTGGKLEPVTCFAGCSGLAQSSLPRTPPPTNTQKAPGFASQNTGGSLCIAGCYGSGMALATDYAGPAASSTNLQTTSGKESSNVTVLRGNTRKRVYGSGN